MLTETVSDERAWTAATIDDPRTWCSTLPQACLDELAVHLTNPAPTTDIRLVEGDLPECRAALAKTVAALTMGRGFALVGGLQLERFSDSQAQRAYWLLGQIIGDPFAQDVNGKLLFDVLDTGRDVKDGARFSVTNVESSFHTDGAFNPAVPDFVGLLCLKTAKSGGKSQLVSAYAVHNGILGEDAVTLETLYGSFCFDRRSEFKKGEIPYTETPIYCWHGAQLHHRFLRLYVEVGHEKAERPLTPAQVDALDAVERQVTDRRMQVEFSMKPGQMLFTNNRWILHNRTGFEDHPDPAKRRHYVHLWLSERRYGSG